MKVMKILFFIKDDLYVKSFLYSINFLQNYRVLLFTFN